MVHSDNIANISSESEWRQLLAEFFNIFTNWDYYQDDWYMAAPGCMLVSMISWVKGKLRRLEELKFITPVDEPTDWNSWMIDDHHH